MAITQPQSPNALGLTHMDGLKKDNAVISVSLPSTRLHFYPRQKSLATIWEVGGGGGKKDGGYNMEEERKRGRAWKDEIERWSDWEGDGERGLMQPRFPLSRKRERKESREWVRKREREREGSAQGNDIKWVGHGLNSYTCCLHFSQINMAPSLYRLPLSFPLLSPSISSSFPFSTLFCEEREVRISRTLPELVRYLFWWDGRVRS